MRGDTSVSASQITQPTILNALLVKPREACALLRCGNTKLYALLAAGELQFFRDGASRQIVVQSIHDYIARRLEIAVSNNPTSRDRSALEGCSRPRTTRNKATEVVA